MMMPDDEVSPMMVRLVPLWQRTAQRDGVADEAGAKNNRKGTAARPDAAAFGVGVVVAAVIASQHAGTHAARIIRRVDGYGRRCARQAAGSTSIRQAPTNAAKS